MWSDIMKFSVGINYGLPMHVWFSANKPLPRRKLSFVEPSTRDASLRAIYCTRNSYADQLLDE